MTSDEIRGNKKSRFPVCVTKIVAVVLALVSVTILSSCTGGISSRLVAEARQSVVSADAFMGDWQGIKKSGGSESPVAAQVIALGKGKYQANLLEEFDKRIAPIAVLDGQLEGTAVRFTQRADSNKKGDILWTGTIKGNKFTGSLGQESQERFVMHRVFRVSPTLGASPPVDAVVLFDGKNFDHWKHAKKSDKEPVRWRLVDGAMEVVRRTGSIITKRKFTDFRLHLEFRTPFMPESRGQGRGNSGVYLQGRYEVQILDSYGLEGRDNECGGIYKVGIPRVNMCAPPRQWQSYDITFHAPRFDGAGNKVNEARVTTLHNGVKIHDDIKVPMPTTAALDQNVTEPGGIYLQDHGNPMQYRNIWLVELPQD